jgi:hypothetical protein
MKYVIPEVINLKNSKEFNEKWLQARIEENPTIIGLGDIEFRDTEKIQIGGGRLDTILYNPEDLKRYEVEIQLGQTDETHIIRTIEYWDLERKKNPQYSHCAVIIAEDITSRFLNVISLFNGYIPLIAIQVKALKIDGNISLFFTKVLDETKFELLEEDQNIEPTDRKYWQKKASTESLKLMDTIFKSLGDTVAEYNLKYNKYYIGIAKDNMANNFISFTPRKSVVLMNFKLAKSEEFDDLLEHSDIDVLSYDNQWKEYRIRLNKKDIPESLEILKKMTIQAKADYRY